MKRYLILSLFMTVVLFFMGCASRTTDVIKPNATDGAATFVPEGKCIAFAEGKSLIVEGTTNLMDGTNGLISVLNSDGTVAAKQKFTQNGEDISQEFEIKNDWTDIVYGYITYSTQQGDKQPKEVVNAYGKKFENMTGENVIWDLKGDIAVFQSSPIRVRGENG